MSKLDGLKVAMLVTNGFEQSELEEPKKALENEGAKVDIISPRNGEVKAWKHNDWGDNFSVTVELNKANPNSYDALVLPGGVMNPDQLRIDQQAVSFVKNFVDSNKPIAAICHGPWTLIEAGGVKGKTLTSWPSLQSDLSNAGAKWVLQQVVNDNNLVTSRKPDDLPAFNAEMIKLFSKGK